ncbi:DUF4283 domain protein [Medicago truncatula]|uniref:DUF4283 domain protein n=1 Tax=Medicago truncatula TaxID=3880 RepID=A0A072V890_MEDTR|nr:DUF4283 domain protein [Medicago truncatula]
MEKQLFYSGSLLNVNEFSGVFLNVPQFGDPNLNVVISDRPSAEQVVEKPVSALDKVASYKEVVVPIVKGDHPLKLEDFCAKLNTLWKALSKWGIVSLGRGFYEFVFSSAEDVKHVRAVLTWSLKRGFLKLFARSPDFNSNNHKQTTTQCWVRFLELPQEYWSPNILSAFASCLETPMCLDAATITQEKVITHEKHKCLGKKHVLVQNDDLGKEPTDRVTNNVIETCVDNNHHLKSANVLKSTVDGKVVSIDVMPQEDICAQTNCEPQREDCPDMHLVGSWNDALEKGNGVADDNLNPIVAHDMEILMKYYLKNRSTATEEPFTKVVSKTTKKNLKKGFLVHNTRSKGRLPD